MKLNLDEHDFTGIDLITSEGLKHINEQLVLAQDCIMVTPSLFDRIEAIGVEEAIKELDQDEFMMIGMKLNEPFQPLHDRTIELY